MNREQRRAMLKNVNKKFTGFDLTDGTLKIPCKENSGKYLFIPCAYIVGGNCTFSVLLDGGYLNKRLRCLQFGKNTKPYCNVAYVGELQKCIHISASFKISGKYFVVYRCDNWPRRWMW